MSDQINSRRRFLRTTAVGIGAMQLSLTGLVRAQSNQPAQDVAATNGATSNASFGQIKQINAGTLNVGYAEAGPENCFVEVAPILAAAGYRVIVPYLRGYGSTRFLSSKTMRNGQQAVVAVDIIALMDALKIQKAVFGAFDWGARTANIIAALWPERCAGQVSVSGYLIGSPQANKAPLPRGGISFTSPRSADVLATRPTGMIFRNSSGSLHRRNGASTMQLMTGPQRPSGIPIMLQW